MHEDRSSTSYERKEETAKRRPTLAVDFDGVIANYDGWKGAGVCGSPRSDVIGVMQVLRAEGWKLVVHTTRSPEEIAEFLSLYEVPFDEINRNSDYANGGVKPVATIYWDDRSLRYSGDAYADLEAIRSFATWSGRK